MKKQIVAVVGPTASGKTSLAIGLSKRFDGEIISADSMQIYRGMDIGTAKPNAFELSQAKHHMIDIKDPKETFSVADFCEMANILTEDIIKRGHLPIIAGGTGLYTDSFLGGVSFSSPKGDEKIRQELKNICEKKGKAHLFSILEKEDYEASKTIHPNDEKRIIRAIEAYRTSGKTKKERNDESKSNTVFDSVYFMIDYDRDVLYERINMRVEKMFDDGLVDEVKNVILPIRDNAPTSACAIGYKEVLMYLDGKISLFDAKELIKQESRRYAKRQLTWFRRNKDIVLLSPQYALEEATKHLENIGFKIKTED